MCIFHYVLICFGLVYCFSFSSSTLISLSTSLVMYVSMSIRKSHTTVLSLTMINLLNVLMSAQICSRLRAALAAAIAFASFWLDFGSSLWARAPGVRLGSCLKDFLVRRAGERAWSPLCRDSPLCRLLRLRPLFHFFAPLWLCCL